MTKLPIFQATSRLQVIAVLTYIVEILEVI